MVLTRINNNVSAFNASRNLNTTSVALGRSLERLSSGLRINRAADDAAGLSISESQRSQIRGLARAISNAQDAISLVNTAEGALNESMTRLQRMRELAVQASNTGGNDAAAIQAIQDEIEQSIAEITRIADTTQFGTRKVLNGSVAAVATIVTGTSNGASVAISPVASNLTNGTHILHISQTQAGSETFQVGTDGVNNSNAFNITNSTFDSGNYTLLVSNAVAASAQVQVTTTFGGTTPAQAQVLDTDQFTGTGALTGGDLLTGAAYAATGLDYDDTITVTGVDAAGNAVSGVFTIDSGSTLSDLMAFIQSLYSGSTASIAADGSIRLSDDLTGVSVTTMTLVVASGVNVLGTDAAAVLATGFDGFSGLTGGSALAGESYLGQTLASGQAIEISGRNASGVTVTASLTITGATTLADLVNAISTAFTGSTATLSGGRIILTDDATGTSNTAMTLTLQSGANTLAFDNAVVTTLGAANSASVSFGGGPAVRVSNGDTATLFGRIGTDGQVQQISMTFGVLSNGVDNIAIVEQRFSAMLDTGNAVSFQNGDKNIRFESGSGGSIILDFDALVTSGTTIIDSVNNGLYFQIGANAGQGISVSIGDLSADKIGFANQTGRSVADISVTTLTGAQDALAIIDEALAQVSRQRSALGAATNRLESTIANLGVAQENLTSAESRIRDADIAFETTIFTRNQILLQAGTSILAQANTAPQAVLQLLG